MFNPDLKKMLENVNSRYSLVVGTAKRAREIREEAIENECYTSEHAYQYRNGGICRK